MAKLVSQKAKVSYNMGPKRPNKPSKAVVDAIQGAVTRALGPGYSVSVVSGKENPGQRHGSNRHGTGLAADIQITDPTGQRLNAFDNKQEMLAVAEAFKSLGGLGVGVGTDYMGGVSMHLDMVEAGPGQDNAWGNIGNANQAHLESFYRSPIQAALPDTMQAPLSLAQTQMRDEAIATAFADPTRALDIPAAPFSPPSRPATPTPTMALNSISPPSRFPGVAIGQVTRAPLHAIPASLTPAPIGRVERAPLPDIGQFTTPARSLQHPVSAPKPAPLAAAPVSPVTRAPLAPAMPNAQTLAEQYAQYRPAKAVNMPTVATPPSVPVGTLPAAPAPVAPPAETVAPAQVLAPALAPPTTIQDRPIASIAPAPAPTAYDVYSGLAPEAMDNTGQNKVGTVPGGITTVTNKYGVTTGMTPYGKQTAVGNMPSIPGISGPLGRTLGKMAMPAVGGLLGGPLGGMVGALAAYGLSRPGGILSGINNIDTSAVAASGLIPGIGNVTAFAKPNYGLNQFPGRPSGMRTSSGFSSDGVRSAAYSRSPAAAADIDAGRGGLF